MAAFRKRFQLGAYQPCCGSGA